MKKHIFALAVLIITIIVVARPDNPSRYNPEGSLETQGVGNKIKAVKEKIITKIEELKKEPDPDEGKVLLESSQPRNYEIYYGETGLNVANIATEKGVEGIGIYKVQNNCEDPNTGKPIASCYGRMILIINQPENDGDYSKYSHDYAIGKDTNDKLTIDNNYNLKMESWWVPINELLPQTTDKSEEGRYDIQKGQIDFYVNFKENGTWNVDDCYRYGITFEAKTVYGSNKATFNEETQTYYAGDLYEYDANNKQNKYLKFVPVSIEPLGYKVESCKDVDFFL